MNRASRPDMGEEEILAIERMLHSASARCAALLAGCALGGLGLAALPLRDDDPRVAVLMVSAALWLAWVVCDFALIPLHAKQALSRVRAASAARRSRRPAGGLKGAVARRYQLTVSRRGSASGPPTAKWYRDWKAVSRKPSTWWTGSSKKQPMPVARKPAASASR